MIFKSIHVKVTMTNNTVIKRAVANRMSRANSGVFECNEFPDLQRILDFLSLRNLLSNKLFFTFELRL